MDQFRHVCMDVLWTDNWTEISQDEARTHWSLPSRARMAPGSTKSRRARSALYGSPSARVVRSVNFLVYPSVQKIRSLSIRLCVTWCVARPSSLLFGSLSGPDRAPCQ